jgi:cytochrome c553
MTLETFPMNHHRATMLALLLLAAVTAQAQSPDLRAGAYLGANCANCHGTAGRSVNNLPRLAGMPREAFVAHLRDFRDGRRAATIMHQLSKGYTDEQVNLMAEYFSRQAAK